MGELTGHSSMVISWSSNHFVVLALWAGRMGTRHWCLFIKNTDYEYKLKAAKIQMFIRFHIIFDLHPKALLDCLSQSIKLPCITPSKSFLLQQRFQTSVFFSKNINHYFSLTSNNSTLGTQTKCLLSKCWYLMVRMMWLIEFRIKDLSFKLCLHTSCFIFQ